MTVKPLRKPCSSKAYTYISARSGRKGGEIRYRGKLLKSKLDKRFTDKFIHKMMCSRLSDEEKCRIKHEICELILSRDHRKLKESKSLISKYCMLFDNHADLTDDWTKMWTVAHAFQTK